ncbi:G protein-coupled glucose receptor regulating Gpa2-domain-containing protein [Podospora didyma]|uniref:G protein-coupled glucose receptor regulating Gpa2-domain-containing protein n=1 Tax=Podospora didyma TaxID=330526 RepID=A0AAE0NX59_9PEZI|nr:G protein-coupled glucose receptor regulating Gpa2-domain-containing protein [Podospora didyma]
MTARQLAEDDDRPSRQVLILTVISLACASLSVFATLFTLYWFVKMRRSFRHELIMLLIQSDFIKSAAFVVFPIVNFARGPITSDSAFCQISGFSLAVGIESSDIAVLLIALHSVMYIFSPLSGLYPYRQLAYLVYYLFPVLAASLAFIDGQGYENLGHYCYLRTDRAWSRLALSWVPRYVIGVSIIVIYAFIYFYIIKRMDDYGRRSSGYLAQPRPTRDHFHDVPPMPRISYHGLLPSTPSSRRGSGADSVATSKDRQRSASSVSTIRLDNNTAAPGAAEQNHRQHAIWTSQSSKRPIQWNWAGFKQAAKSSSGDNGLLAADDEANDPLSPDLAPLASPPAVHSPRINTVDQNLAPVVEAPSDTSSLNSLHHSSFWHRPLASACATHPGSSSVAESTADQPGAHPHHHRGHLNVSLPNIITMLRRGPPHLHPQAHPHRHGATTATAKTRTTTAETSPSMSPALSFDDTSGIYKSREKIRRQLRSLFAYPLVYMVIWVFPFLSHTLGYDDAVITRPDDPQWLLVIGIVSLSIQGVVNCTLFNIREKPWRHSRGGFVKALRKRLTIKWNGSWRDVGLAGRTREEMLVDGRIARERRDEEVAYERALRAERAAAQGQGAGEGQANGAAGVRSKGRREWWDAEVQDGIWDDGDDDLAPPRRARRRAS